MQHARDKYLVEVPILITKMVRVHYMKLALRVGLLRVFDAVGLNVYAHVCVARLQECRGKFARAAPQVQDARLPAFLAAYLLRHGHKLAPDYAVLLDEVELQYLAEEV